MCICAGCTCVLYCIGVWWFCIHRWLLQVRTNSNVPAREDGDATGHAETLRSLLAFPFSFLRCVLVLLGGLVCDLGLSHFGGKVLNLQCISIVLCAIKVSMVLR